MGKLYADKPKYFEIQYLNSRDSILPFLEGVYTPKAGDNVLEIGSSEGGVLKAFTELGCICTGIELELSRVELANEFMREEVSNGLVKFINQNIYDIDPNTVIPKFDLIILKDVIEHIHNQEKFMQQVEHFLSKDGVIFFGFPAWRMPYGGHQQCAKSKLLANLPYYHLLPKALYKMILKMFGESDSVIEGLLEIKETGISTSRFEKICKENNYTILKQVKYFVAPIYEYKFGFKTRKLSKLVGAIPYFNDFFTFQSYYVIKKNK
jgi:2-polyprenyl-3-methyl-5-hydroxy-6-metoxy-1,4-benzoquinol methylase